MIEAREAAIIRHINTSQTIERARRLRQVLFRGLGPLLLDIEVRDFNIRSLALTLLEDFLHKVQSTMVLTTSDIGILMVSLEKWQRIQLLRKRVGVRPRCPA